MLDRGRLLRRVPRELLLACVLSLVPFLFVWGQGRLFYDADLTLITAPIEDLFARYQRQGQLPLWAPELQMGYPLIAISHLGFFYPLHALLRLALPGVLTLNLSLALHALLGAAGMYALLRHEHLGHSAAAFGALVFSGTGFFIGHLTATNILLPLTWVPLQLWLLGQWLHPDRSNAERRHASSAAGLSVRAGTVPPPTAGESEPRIPESRSLGGTRKARRMLAALRHEAWFSLLGLSVAVALQILLGHPQSALIGAVALALYALAHAFTSPRRTILRLIPLVPAAGLSFLLAYAQIRPTLDVVPYSDRADAFVEKELYEFGFPFHHLVSWVFPHAFGYRDVYIGGKNDTELATWFGVTALLLAGVGLLSVHRRGVRRHVFIALLLATALLMAAGRFSPLYRYLVEQNVLTNLAVPARWMFLAVLGVAFLSAQGLDSLIERTPRQRLRRLAFAAGIITLLTATAWSALPEQIAGAVRANLALHPFRTAMPFMAAAAVVVLTSWHRAPWPMTQARWPLFSALLALELFLPNITRNVPVPFRQPFHRSRVETSVPHEEPQGRFFAQHDLSVTPPPRVSSKPLKRLDNSFTVQQRLRSRTQEVSGVSLDLRWGRETPSDGTVQMTLRDEQTGEERAGTVASREASDSRMLETRFAPLRGVEGHPLLLTITNTHATKGPWIMYARTDGHQDTLPGGSVELCDARGCRRPEIAGALHEEIDLVVELKGPRGDPTALAQELLVPHLAASKGIAETQWLGALQLHDVKRYLYSIGDQNENAVRHNPLLRDRRTMVDRLGVAYLLGSYGDDRTLGLTDGIELLDEYLWGGQTIRLYQNRHAYPRAHFAARVASVTHPDSALALLQSPTTPQELVVVEDDLQAKDVPLTTGEAAITAYMPTRVAVATRNHGAGFLVLRDTFFPGWEADVDGARTRIYPTDMLFRGVLVPPGDHTVTFRYEPRKMLQAIRVSAVSWATVILLTLVYFFARYRQKAQMSKFK